MASNLHTGEFDPGILNRPLGNAVSAFDGQLWVIGAGGDNRIYQTRFTFDGNSSEWALTSSSDWVTTVFSVNATYPKASGKCASDVLGDGSTLYLFWNGSSFIGAASTEGQPATGTPTWPQAFALLDNTGKLLTPRSAGCDVSAVAFGDDAFLVAFPIEQAGTPAVFIGLYSTTGQQPQNSISTSEGSFGMWPAQAQAIITCDMLNNFPENGSPPVTYRDVGRSVSITWFASAPASGGDPQTLLMAFMTPELNKDGGTLNWSIQLLVPIDPTSGAPMPAGSASPMILYNNTTPASYVTAARDPANRVIGYGMTGGPAIQRFLYSTWSIPNNAPLAETDCKVETWDSAAPAVTFYIDTANPIVPGDGSVVAYNVYRFIFYHGARIKAQADYYGMVEQLPTVDLVSNPPLMSTPAIVKGIFDSPFPIPNVNVVGFQFENNNNDQGDITYGVSNTMATGYTQSVSGAAGIKTEGSAGFIVKFAWEASLMGGGQSVWGYLNTSTMTNEVIQKTNVHANNNKVGDYVIPEATFIMETPKLTATGYRFIDEQGNAIGDATSSSDTDQAPRTYAVNVGQNGSLDVEYMPYMVTPGDLASYTPEQIDATMARLYGQVGWTVPDNGYFQGVLLKNGYVFPSGLPYLRYQLNSNSGGLNAWNALHQQNKQWGWNVSLSAYAGVSWDIPGSDVAPFSSSGNVMAGLTFEASGNWTNNSSNDIGISISNLEFPIWGDQNMSYYAPGAWAQAICDYVVLLIYLPPPGPDSKPTLWADELRQFAKPETPAAIDDGSQPWRIVFVVIAYQTNGTAQSTGQWDYYYPGDLGAPIPAPGAKSSAAAG
jgi:hypothetical protein